MGSEQSKRTRDAAGNSKGKETNRRSKPAAPPPEAEEGSGIEGSGPTPNDTETDTQSLSVQSLSISKPKPKSKSHQPTMPNATVPCQYRTGKTLGSGTYAIVKEAIHIKTGKYYACKVINKKLMEGREHMVRNEIAVLKRISSGNPNIVTLHDYFEVSRRARLSCVYLSRPFCMYHPHRARGPLADGLVVCFAGECGTRGYAPLSASAAIAQTLPSLATIHAHRLWAVLRRLRSLARFPSASASLVLSVYDIALPTSHNLYLCFDLCTGGELFDRICAKGNYYEADAASLVRTILTAVAYIHAAGIVHRDLKPENLLFRTPAEEADIMIADFGLSRIMEEEKLSLLTEICGTPGYMAPEIFLKTGHSKPVDVWAMGVVTYFLLAGYTPFDRDTPKLEMEAIIAGDYKFEPEEYWANVSDTARDFVRACLTIDPERRPTAAECLEHKWLASTTPHFVSTPSGGPTDLLPHVKKAFNAKLTWKKAAFSIKALHRMTALAGGQHPLGKAAAELSENVRQYKEESAQEVMEDASIMHHHNLDHPSDGSGGGTTPKDVTDKLAKTSLQG
ncbi:Pkinase-domain-containing protein [Mycena venus]|uniref:Pkinase-domain-containing protein n=1 Tax=Mycena venus TaxID=2733690 RepID=A0A8H7CNW1_9AGAR|nr:Pkinase-domain-containing protein [Mycena venus]